MLKRWPISSASTLVCSRSPGFLLVVMRADVEFSSGYCMPRAEVFAAPNDSKDALSSKESQLLPIIDFLLYLCFDDPDQGEREKERLWRERFRLAHCFLSAGCVLLCVQRGRAWPRLARSPARLPAPSEPVPCQARRR